MTAPFIVATESLSSMLITRRTSLSIAAASVLTTLAACGSDAKPKPATSSTAHPHPKTRPASAPHTDKVALPNEPITALPPSRTRRVALTIDDGIDPVDVRNYTKLCRETGMRLTFFANGCYDSWRQVKPLLAPLVESGQIVIGNHTWNHPSLVTLTDEQIAWQMTTNDKHFRDLYGVKTLRPFMRPPYGYHNLRVDRTLRRLGYGGIVLWAGTLGDDQNITTPTIERNARRWLVDGSVDIGHANHHGTEDAVETIGKIIEQRKLQTVTVADVWAKPTGD